MKGKGRREMGDNKDTDQNEERKRKMGLLVMPYGLVDCVDSGVSKLWLGYGKAYQSEDTKRVSTLVLLARNLYCRVAKLAKRTNDRPLPMPSEIADPSPPATSPLMRWKSVENKFWLLDVR